MEKDLSSKFSEVKEDLNEQLDLDEFDNKLDELKNHIKKLKKLKKRQEKYQKLEREKEYIMRKLEEKDDKKKHRHK